MQKKIQNWFDRLDILQLQLSNPNNSIPDKVKTKLGTTASIFVLSTFACLGVQIMLFKDFKKNITTRPMPYAKPLIASMVAMLGSSVFLYHSIEEAYKYLPDVLEAPPVKNELADKETTSKQSLALLK